MTRSLTGVFLGEFLQKEMHVFFAENEAKDKDKLEQWEQEHWEMLCRIAPAQFTVRHYAALAELEKR